jgi:hypothetical protein
MSFLLSVEIFVDADVRVSEELVVQSSGTPYLILTPD